MGRDGAVVDDAATLWGLRLHLLERMRQAIKLAMQIHAHGLTPCLTRHIARQGVRDGHTRVVEQQVDTAKFGDDGGKHFGDVFLFRHVGRYRKGIGFVIASGVYRSLQGVCAASDQGHFPAIFQQAERTGFANTRACARHDCYLCHLNSSLFSMVFLMVVFGHSCTAHAA